MQLTREKSASRFGNCSKRFRDLALLSGLAIKKSIEEMWFPKKKGCSPKNSVRVGANNVSHFSFALEMYPWSCSCSGFSVCRKSDARNGYTVAMMYCCKCRNFARSMVTRYLVWGETYAVYHMFLKDM